MAPTFPIFVGFIIYLGWIAIAMVVFIPMLLFPSKRLFAIKGIATVLISFPCLIVMGLLNALMFLIPALTFKWLAETELISRIIGMCIGLPGVLLFVMSVVTSSLYLWYFTSKIIYHLLDEKPIKEFIYNDKVYKFFSSFLGYSSPL